MCLVKLQKALLLGFVILSSALWGVQPMEDSRGVVAFELFDETLVHEEKENAGVFKDLNISLFLFKTTDKRINIEQVKNYDLNFSSFDINEKFQDKNLTYWLKVELNSNFPDGEHMVSYGDVKILEHTFLDIQKADSFEIGGTHHFKFNYNHLRDKPTYYFKLLPSYYDNSYRYLFITSKANFYDELNKSVVLTLLLGMIMGLIFMAGLYNGAMYYYNKDKSFLYYMFMQWSVTLVLFNMTGIISFTELSIARSETYYSLCSLLGVLFTTLFTKTFLDTKIHSPKLDMMLNIFMIMILIDAVFSIFYVSIIFKYNLLPFMALSYIYLAFKRVKQGFTPAKFYLAGWVFLVLSLFLDAFWKFEFMVNPIFLGTAIEAILFSFALSYKVKMINFEREQQKELMVHQSKLASMGEMLGNIAHQWRQPLTHLSYTVMNIEDAFKHDDLTQEYLGKKVNEANGQIEFMSQTIDDFRDFYAVNKPKEYFSLEVETKETLKIMTHALKEKDIEIVFMVNEDLEVYSYKNEYKQILLNLLSNAKDALVQRLVLMPKIIVTVNKNEVTVADNAGGIESENMNKIFEPYFSTKEGNSGIGLYMSKMIAHRRMDMNLSVKNQNGGAVFTLIF